MGSIFSTNKITKLLKEASGALYTNTDTYSLIAECQNVFYSQRTPEEEIQ